MEYAISIDHDSGCFLITTQGLIDSYPILAALTELVARPDWRDGGHVIIDHRNSDALRLIGADSARMIRLFTRFRSQLAGSRIALLMREPTQFGLAQLWQTALLGEESIETRIFLSPVEARSWVQRNSRSSHEAEG